jgi:hypothetical protein
LVPFLRYAALKMQLHRKMQKGPKGPLASAKESLMRTTSWLLALQLSSQVLQL